MKRILSLFLAIAMILSMSVPSFADAGGSTVLTADKTAVSPGDTIEIRVALADMPKIKALAFKILYDDSVITLGEGTWKLENSVLSNFNATKAVAAINFSVEKDLNGEVLTFTATVNSDVALGTETTITVQTTAKDASTNVLACTDGTLKISTCCTNHDIQLVNAVAATCTTDGYTGDQVCKKCAAVVKSGSVIKATGHAWDETAYTWNGVTQCTAKRICKNDPSHVEEENATVTDTVTKQPGCETEGVRTYTAVFSSEWAETQTKTESIDAISHSYGQTTYSWSSDNTTCTAQRVCANDASHVDTATVNTTSEITKQATCGAAGIRTYSADFKVSWAVDQTKEEQLPALEHVYGEPTYKWNSDYTQCTAKRVCTNDPSHIQASIGTVTSEVSIAATCEAPGEQIYTAAFSVDWASTQTVKAPIPATDHTYGAATYAWSEDGSICTAQRVCSSDTSHVQTADAAVTWEDTVPATCAGKGQRTFTAVFTADWAETQTTVREIPALDHVWGEPTYLWAEDGSSCTATVSCTGKGCTETITENGTVTSAVAIPAACTENGTTTYTAAFENQMFTSQTKDIADVAALDHAWGEPVYTWAEDGSSCTATVSCTREGCTETITENGTVTSAVAIPAACTENGTTTYTAAFENQMFTSQTKDIADVAALDHAWGEPVYTWAEDGSSCTATVSCTREGCTETITENGTVTSAVTTPAACTETGTTTYTAAFENALFAMQTKDIADIAELGHDLCFDHVDETSVPYHNVYTCSRCTYSEDTEEIATPKATLVSLDCDSTLSINLNDPPESVTICAAVLPKNALQDVKWTGMNTAYAAFTANEDGSVTISDYVGKTGSLTLTCTAADGSKVKAAVKLSFTKFAEELSILDSKSQEIDSYTLTGKTSYTFKTTLAADKNLTNKTVTWSLAYPDGSSCADVASVDAKGKVTAKSFATENSENVTVELTAAASANEEARDTITITLVPNLTQGIEIEGIRDEGTLNDRTVSVDINEETVLLTANPVNYEPTESVVWSSSSKSVATVDAEGLVTLKGTGTATITAKIGSVKASFKLTVVRYVESITITNPVETLAYGKSVTFKTTLTPTKPSSKTLIWTLDEGDEAYATLSNGKLTARKGLLERYTVTVHVASKDGHAEETIRVELVPIATGVTVTGAPTGKVDVQESICLFADIVPQAAPQNVTWTSSSKSYPIDAEGNITPTSAAKAATVTFTATAKDGSGKKASVKISFVRLMTDDALTMPASAVLGVGKSLTISAKVTSTVTNQKLTWTLENPEDAQYVTLKSNKVTALKTLNAADLPVTVTVRATAQDGSGVSKTCDVTIYPLTTAVNLYDAQENLVNGTTIVWDSTDSMILTAASKAGTYDGAPAWTVKSSNSSVEATIDGETITVNVKASKTVKSGTKVTITVTATDGSSKSAKVTLKVS